MPPFCSCAAPVDVDAGWLASPYGPRPGRTTGATRTHAGIDVGAAAGAAVYAVAPGVIEYAIREQDAIGGFRGYGNCVVLRVVLPDEPPTWVLFAHLASVEVEAGDRVQAWKRLGYVGNSSNGLFPTMGAHLHVECRNATSSGGAPFPGPYGSYNLDPQAWLAAHGVTFDRQHVVLGQPRRTAIQLDLRAACPRTNIPEWLLRLFQVATTGGFLHQR